MPLPLVVVAPPSRFSLSRLPLRVITLLLALVLACQPSRAQEATLGEQHYVADIELQAVDELRQLLERAELLLTAGQVPSDGEAAVTFVLHGPVVRSLLRQNYLANKATVDLAASLSALGVVDIKACRTWMGFNNVNEADLQPFVETVAYSAAEVQRLIKERNYIYF